MKRDPIKFLKANGHDLGMLTGQDRAALLAISACWEVWALGDSAAREACVRAIRALLYAMQEKCWPLARELIAFSLDWGDRDRLWPEVRPDTGS